VQINQSMKISAQYVLRRAPLLPNSTLQGFLKPVGPDFSRANRTPYKTPATLPQAGVKAQP
jgi:hypothetical protein